MPKVLLGEGRCSGQPAPFALLWLPHHSLLQRCLPGTHPPAQCLVLQNSRMCPETIVRAAPIWRCMIL